MYAHPLAPSPAASFYASPAQGPTGRADNSVLQWTGASVIQSLAAILLTSVYPDLKEGALNVSSLFSRRGRRGRRSGRALRDAN